MAYINDRVLDNGLSALSSEGNRLFICSSEPTTYTQASSTYALGVKTSPAYSSISANSPTGRKITLTAITDGSCTASGTAAYWAIADATNSRLLAASSLASSVSVLNGQTFTLGAIDIVFPGV